MDCDNDAAGTMLVIMAVDQVPNGYLQVLVPLCAEHLAAAGALPEILPVSVAVT